MISSKLIRADNNSLLLHPLNGLYGRRCGNNPFWSYFRLAGHTPRIAELMALYFSP